MVNFKEKILDNLFIIYLILFPLGQIFRGYYIADAVVLVIAIITLFTNKNLLDHKGKFLTYLMIGVFSILFSLSFFDPNQIVTGIMYFVRLTSYILLFFFVRERYKQEPEKETIYRNLLIINFVVIVFGLIQYFFIPDLRYLREFGWDDHYFRLVSTYLDPAFTGIIFLIGLILSVNLYLQRGQGKYFLLSTLNVLVIALTYSRATYLSLLLSFVFLFWVTKRKIVLLFPIFLLILIPILPRPSSEGVKLERTYSIFQKFDDYEKSLVLISKSPIFGIGFNNTCVAREKYLGESGYMSHSCSGIDNSILFILTTTGVVGLIFFVELLTKIKLKSIFGVTIVAILIHGMFTNTLFYPFVMGLIAIIGAIDSKE